MTKPRVAVVVSHPIQYQAPWFRGLARELDLHVFFCHRQDGAGQAAAGFGVAFEWDVPLLEGYSHSWLENVSPEPGVERFSGCDTPGVGRALAGGHFDACIVQGWYLKSYLQALWACRRLGIPVLARGDSHLQTARNPLWSAAKYVPYRLLLNAYDGHLYVGQKNREYLEHYGVPAARLFFVPHAVDNAFFATRAEEARRSGAAHALRTELGIPQDAVVFAFCGKLLPNKRVADFVRAVGLARQQGMSVFGVILGSGPEEGALRALASNVKAPVSFAGFRNQGDLPAAFSAADALVLPSGGETWGLVVNEAMACGLPAIVSTGVGCGPDLIADGSTGDVFPTGDVEAFALALQRVAVRLQTRPADVQRAVKGTIDRYSIEAAVEGTRRAISSLRHPSRSTAVPGTESGQVL